MIILGTRGIKTTISSGIFHCPQCNQKKPFRHRKITKFFTLYFIPIIPLGKRGEYVECNDCKGTYVSRILENSITLKEDAKALYEKAIKHSMVLVMLADGEIDENEKKQVLKIINKFCLNKITMPQLVDYIKFVKSENENISTYLKKASGYLNEHGKEIIIKAALSVAVADGRIDDSELKMISKMAKSMEMSSAHYKGILFGLNAIIVEQNESNKQEKTEVENKEDHSRFMPKMN
jgi:uncharacterized tellurite resistance protein B-like protein